MGTQPFRVKQTSPTAGTGTLTVTAPPTGLRGFNEHYGAGPVTVPYVLQGPSGQNPTYCEMGFGSFANASSQLTRPSGNVIESSNADSLVALPEGTHDVFAFMPPWWSPVVAVTATQSLALRGVGSLHVFTGSSAADLDLPALGNVPDGFSIPFRNAGTAIWSFDPNGSETIEGSSTSLRIYPGESGLLYRASDTDWGVIFQGRGPVLLQSQAASAVATVDFTSFLDDGFDRYEIHFDAVKPASDDAALQLRVGTGAGPTWQSGGSAYAYGALAQFSGAAGNVGSTAASAIVIGQNAGALNAVGNGAGEHTTGVIEFANPDSGDFMLIRFRSSWVAATSPVPGWASGGGMYLTAGAITGIRLFFSTGNIASGTFRKYGWRK